MNGRTLCAANVVMMVVALSGQAWAQNGQFKLDGEIHDFTAPLDPPDPSGVWQVDGEWMLTLNLANGKIDIAAALNMIRSDSVTRAAHTHHMTMTAATVTPIANGYRISGPATFTSNGATAGFSGSPVDVDVTGGSAVQFASVKVKFGGAAASHFGAQALGGVVNLQK